MNILPMGDFRIVIVMVELGHGSDVKGVPRGAETLVLLALIVKEIAAGGILMRTHRLLLVAIHAPINITYQ